jgi:hypothetical protein
MPSGTISATLIAVTVAALVLTGTASGQRRPAGDPAGWAGSYSARFDGARGDLTIVRQPYARAPYRLNMDMAVRGCTGQVEGTGVASGRDRLLFTIPSEFGQEVCRITLTRGRNGVRVEEDHCLEFHGAACAFDGTARKRR